MSSVAFVGAKEVINGASFNGWTLTTAVALALSSPSETS